MKKLFLSAAIIAAMASCSKNEVSQDAPQKAMGFSSFVGNASKVAGETAFEENDVMVVTAYQAASGEEFATGATAAVVYNDGTNGFDNVVITKGSESGASWTYDPVRYWPKPGVTGSTATVGDEKLTFVGLTFAADAAGSTGLTAANLVSTSNDGSGNTVKVAYTNPATAAEQLDLMGDVVLDKVENDGQVTFAYNHLLSQLQFNVDKNEDAAEAIDITAVDLTFANDFSKKGTFSFNLADDTNIGTWTVEASNLQDAIELTANYAIDSTDLPTHVDGSTTAIALMEPIMLIPQGSETAQLEKESIKLSITYKVGENAEKTITRDITLVDGYKTNHKYIYNITISAGGIAFGDCTIVDWETGTTTDMQF